MTSEEVTIKVKLAEHAKGLPFPKYMSEFASGADLHAANQEEVTMRAEEISIIPTGLHIEIPEGYEIQVRPRSGLAAKHGVTLVNTPGTIDADYRGEIKVILINHGKQDFVVKRGERIAQMVLQKVHRAKFEEAQELGETVRGEGGFGHTGK